jgi:hypothetical protein
MIVWKHIDMQACFQWLPTCPKQTCLLYVWIYVCMYVCMYDMHVCMYVCTYACVYAVMLSMYTNIAFENVQANQCEYMPTYIHICIYTNIYIYIYIYIHTYIYIYTKHVLGTCVQQVIHVDATIPSQWSMECNPPTFASIHRPCHYPAAIRCERSS